MDTLRPVTLDGVNDYGGVAVTAIDTLDTLWLADLKDEFNETVDRLRHVSLDIDNDRINVFETCIRVVGGLISAHYLSNDPSLRDMLFDIAYRLLPAFDSVLPYSDINLKTGKARDPEHGASSLSEVSSMGLELVYLGKITKDRRFHDIAIRIQKTLNLSVLPGIFVNRNGEVVSHIVSMGARGDSFYEYLLKCWIQDPARTDLRSTFIRMMQLVEAQLLMQLTEDQCFVDERIFGHRVGKMDHLVCFLPAVLKLAVDWNVLDVHYETTARHILNTCLAMYDMSPVGLAPEITKRTDNRLYASPGDQYNLLRPETFESLYVLRFPDHVTWSIYQNFSKHTKINGAFSSVNSVMQNEVSLLNKMPSYWLAESLKYVFLIMSNRKLPHNVVLNTEAHLIPVS
jgi:mannosyl-oligosaccharide alpha-1,2-mannosidase